MPLDTEHRNRNRLTLLIRKPSAGRLAVFSDPPGKRANAPNWLTLHGLRRRFKHRRKCAMTPLAPHPVGGHRVGGRPHEQVSVHQHRGDGHPPPLRPPRTTNLRAPMTPPPMGRNRPTAWPVSPRTDLARLPPVEHDLLGEAIAHRGRLDLHLGP